MNHINNFFNSVGSGVRYEWNHAATYFSTKSPHARVLIDLFHRVKGRYKKEIGKVNERKQGFAKEMAERVLTVSNAGDREFQCPSDRLVALDLAGISQKAGRKQGRYDSASIFEGEEEIRKYSAFKTKGSFLRIKRKYLTHILNQTIPEKPSQTAQYCRLLTDLMNLSFGEDVVPKDLPEKFQEAKQSRQNFYREVFLAFGNEARQKSCLRKERRRLASLVRELDPGQSCFILGAASADGACRLHPFFLSLVRPRIPDLLYRFLFENDDAEMVEQIKSLVAEQMMPDGAHSAMKLGSRSKDITVRLTETVQRAFERILPQWWYERLVEETKEDLFDLVLGKKPEKNSTLYAERVWERMRGQGIEKTLEMEIADLLHASRKLLTSNLAGFTGRLTEGIPKTMRNALEIAGILSEQEGEFTLEVTKKSGGKVTLKIVSSLQQSELHPKKKRGGAHGTRLPLIYENIPAERLDTNFWTTLLKFQAWPHWKNGVSFSLKDVKDLCDHQFGNSQKKAFFPKNITFKGGLYNWLQLLAYGHLNDAEQVSVFFEFTLPLHALCAYFAEVIHDPKLKRDPSALREIKQLRDRLAAKGKELYRKEAISYPQLRILHATILDLNDKLSQMEGEMPKGAPLSSAVIPSQLQYAIKEILKATGRSEASLQGVKDICLAIFGDEFEEDYESIIRDIIPQLELEEPDYGSWGISDELSYVKGMIPSLKEMKRLPYSPFSMLRIIGRLMRIIHLLWFVKEQARFLAAVLKNLVPKIAMTPLGAEGVAAAAVVFGPDFLNQCVPADLLKPVMAAVALSFEATRYLHWRAGIIMLRCACRLFVSDEVKAGLMRETERLKGQMKREGAITFELENIVKEEPDNFSFVLPRKETLEASGKPPQNFFAKAVDMPPPSKDKVTSKNVQQLLDAWLLEADRIGRSQAYFCEVYLREKISSLPIPSKESRGLWDQAPRPKSLFKSLNRLIRKFSQCCKKSSSFDDFLYLNTAYSLYAILDRVARRIDPDLTDDTLANGAPLMDLIGSRDMRFLKQSSRERFDQICRYFDLDPMREKYTRDDRKQYLAKRLFHFEAFIKFGKGPADYVIAFPMFEATPADCLYLISLLHRKKIKRRLVKSGIDMKLSHVFDAVVVLFLDELNTSQGRRKARLLPATYRNLRFCHLLTVSAADGSRLFIERDGAAIKMKLVQNRFRLKDQHIESVENFLDRYLKLKVRIQGKVLDAFRDGADRKIVPIFSEWGFQSNYRLLHTQPHLRGRFCLTDQFVYHRLHMSRWPLFKVRAGREKVVHNAITAQYANPFQQKSSASRLMIEGISAAWRSKVRTRPFYKHLELLNLDPADQAVRCMSLFTQCKERFGTGEFIWLFDLMVNDPQALRKQLLDRPEIIADFGRFFHEVLAYTAGKHLWTSFLALASVGNELLSRCLDFRGDARGFFPDFSAGIRDEACAYFQKRKMNERTLEECADGLVVSLIYLVSTYFDVELPTNAMLLDMARLAFSQSPFDWETSRTTDLLIESRVCRDVLYRFSGLIKHNMDHNAEFRNRVLNTLVSDMGYDENVDLIWEGEYPTFQADGKSLDLETKVPHVVAGNTRKLEQRASEATGTSLKGGLVSGNRIEYPDYGITVTVLGREAIKIEKAIDGKRYRWIDPSQVSHLAEDAEPSDQFWLESSSKEPALLQFRGDRIFASYRLAAFERQDEVRYELKSVYFHRGGEKLREATSDLASGGLALLNWFCPYSEIKTYVQDAAPHFLKRLEIPSIGLKFDIRKERGDRRAFCLLEGLEGYAILPRQNGRHVRGMCQTLLLENEAKDQKLLHLKLTIKQLISEFLFNHFANVQSTPFLDSLIAARLGENQEPKLALYRCLPNGKLASSDPAALAYLLLHEICLGNMDEVFSTLTALEDAARMASLDDEADRAIGHAFIPLSLSQSDIAEKIMLRLYAVREMNHLVHSKTTEESLGFDLFCWLAVQKKYHDYLSQKKLRHEWYLSPYDELFILKGIGQFSVRLLRKGFGQYLNRLPFNLDALIETFTMMPKLSRRYQELSQLLQGQSGWKHALKRALTEINFWGGEGFDLARLIPESYRSQISDSIEQLTLNDGRGRVEKIFDDFRRRAKNPLADYQTGHIPYHQILPPPQKKPGESFSFSLADLTPAFFRSRFHSFYRLAFGRVPIEWNNGEEKTRLFLEKSSQLKGMLPYLLGSATSHTDAVLQALIGTLASAKDKSGFLCPNFLEEAATLVEAYRQDAFSSKRWKDKALSINPGCLKQLNDKRIKPHRNEQFAIGAWELHTAHKQESMDRFYQLIKQWIDQTAGRPLAQNRLFKLIKRFDLWPGSPYASTNRFQRQIILSRKLIPLVVSKYPGEAVDALEMLKGLQPVSEEMAGLDLSTLLTSSGDDVVLSSIESQDSGSSDNFLRILKRFAEGSLLCSEVVFDLFLDAVNDDLDRSDRFLPADVFDQILDQLILSAAELHPEVSIKKIVARHLVEGITGIECSKEGVARQVCQFALKEFSGLGAVQRFYRYLPYGKRALGCGIWFGTQIHTAVDQSRRGLETAAEELEMWRSCHLQAMTETFPPRQIKSFDQRESAINHLFDDLFHQFLEIDESGECVPSRKTLLLEGGDRNLKTARKLQHSLSWFQKRPPTAFATYRLKKGAKLQDLKRALFNFQREAEAWLRRSERQICHLVNRAHRRVESEGGALIHLLDGDYPGAKPLSFDEIERACLRGHDHFLTSGLRLSPEHLPAVKQKLALYHITASRFRFLFGQLKNIEALDEKNAVQLIGGELARRRVYTFHQTPKLLLRGKLAFEARMGKLLRAKQSTQIDRMLISGEKITRACVQLIMGGGKTWYGIPMTNYCHSSINIWPAPVAETNIVNIGRQVRCAFDQSAFAVSFSRATPWTRRQLWGLLRVFEKCHREKQQINMTKESLQALELCFLEFALDVQGKYRRCRDWDERIDLFRRLLLHVRTRGKGVIDETHIAFDDRKELNHPLGKYKCLKKAFVSLTAEILQALCETAEIQQWLSIKTEKPSPLPKEVYKRFVMPRLAGEVVRRASFGMDKKHSETLKIYLMGSADSVPEIVKESPRREMIDLAKGLISIILPAALEKTIHVDFARSKKGNGEYARPSDGNDNPLESATIRSPFEALVKTGLMLLHDRLTVKQTRRLIKRLKAQARYSAREEHLPISETSEGKFFSRLCPGYTLDTFTERDEEEVFRLLNQSDAFVLKYLREYVSKEIRYFGMNLSSNSTNFGSMFHSFFTDTGTPYNEGCYPTGTRVIEDPGTDGESVDLILDHREGGVIHSVDCLQQNAPWAVLDEIIQNYFSKDHLKARALIDRGAALNGLSNESVARRLLSQAPSNIKGVAYYEGSRLVVIERDSIGVIAEKPTPFSICSLKAEERLSYFAQPQTFAADIPQENGALGIVTLGEDTTFNQLAQAVWRMRGLKTADQKILFTMTRPVLKRLCPDRDQASAQDILTFVIRNEDAQLKESHYKADKQKMHDVIRSAALSKALEEADSHRLRDVIFEFQDLFVTDILDDPTALFGHVDKMVRPELIFESLKKKYRELVDRSPSFNRKEKRRIAARLQKIGSGLYPGKVHTYVEGGHVLAGCLDDIGKSVQIDVHSEADTEIELDMDLDLDLDLDTNLSGSKGNVAVQVYQHWPKRIDLTKTDWLRLSPAMGLNAYVGFKWKHLIPSRESFAWSPPPIFQLRGALENAGGGDVAAIAPSVSEIILSSNNVTYLDAANGCPIEPFGPHQIPILQALFIGEEGSLPKLLLLDQREASRWREYLRDDRLEQKSSIKLALVDIATKIISAHGYTRVDKADLDDPIVDMAFLQLRFLKGDVEYSDKELEHLKQWIKPRFADMEHYFIRANKRHGLKKYRGSKVEELFIELNMDS